MQRRLGKLGNLLTTLSAFLFTIICLVSLSTYANTADTVYLKDVADSKNSAYLKEDAPVHYVVKTGDTLWDIAGHYLHHPWQWQYIWAANQQLKNPNLIYPGDVLLICTIDGNARVGVNAGEGCQGIVRNMQTSQAAKQSPIPSANLVSSHSQVSSHTHIPSQQVRITPLQHSIPAVPLVAIENWLGKVSIVDEEDFKHTPVVIASRSGNLLSAEGDKIYAAGVPLIVGQDYGIYRAGKSYIEAESLQSLGLEVTQVAKGKVISLSENGVSGIQLSESYASEVRQGDRVFIEQYQGLQPVYFPKPASINYDGQIIKVLNSVNNAGKGSVVTINLGHQHGAKAGDVFVVFRRGDIATVTVPREATREAVGNVESVRLPSEHAGYLMVFRVFDKLSYAYILESERPLTIGDAVLSPFPPVL